MKAWTSLLLWLSLGFWLGSTASAQTQVQHPGGFRAQVPSGYQVKQDQQGVMFSNTTQIMVLTPHQYADFASFAADAQLERDGFSLVGEPRQAGSTIHIRAARPKAEGGYLIADAFLAFSPFGGGCLVVAFSDDKAPESAYYTAQSVATSLEFVRPEASPWETALRGKHLLYLSTGNGYSERFDLYLHPQGTFTTSQDASSLSVHGSGTLAGGGEGRWHISPAGQLQLSYADGRSSSYTLAPGAASNEVQLNGRRFFVLDR